MLLELERATFACVVSLDRAIEVKHSGPLFAIDRDTTPDDYRAVLRGAQPGEGWIHDMGRFGCSSDIGQWSMYCERNNEIAVIGIPSSMPLERYQPVLRQLHAVHIAAAIENSLSYGFSADQAVPRLPY